MKRLFLFFAAIFVAVSMMAASFTKVTSAPASWDGEYILAAIASDGKALVWTGVDAGQCRDSVVVTDDVITSNDAITITVEALTEGYSVKVNGGEHDGTYLSSGTSAPTYSNGLKFVPAPVRVDFAFNADGTVAMSQTTASGIMYLIYNQNTGTNNERYRFYKQTNYGTANYLTPCLFKKETTGGDQPSEPEFTIESNIAGRLAHLGTLATGMTGTSNNRGGFIVKEDGVFFANGATGFMKKMDLALSAVTDDTDSIGTGYYMDLDAAGHIVIYKWTGGSASLDIAQVYDANYDLIREDTLKLNGRCDMPALIGNLVQGNAAYFTASNAAQSVLRHNVVDGVLTSVDTIALGFSMGSNNSVSALDVDHFYVQSRGNALVYVDMSGAAPVVTNMPYFGASTFTSCYGGQIFKFAGHTLYVMGTYKVGGYLGSFAVFDVTDPANPYVVAEEKTKLTGSAMGTACVTFRVVVEGQTAHIYEYAAHQVRKYDLTVAPATYLKQGNEGAQWQAMSLTDNGYALEGIYMADSLYINGIAADEGATKFTRANITYNGEVCVNDTVRFNYSNGAVTIDSLGHFVPTVTFNVLVPANTPECYINGNFNNWTFTRMAQLTDTTYTYTYRADDAIEANMEYKYCAGADLKYVEKGANGEEIANRAWQANDTVLTWAAVPVVNVITYELNGGVTNDYGWTSKGAVALDLMNDYNTTYNTSKVWAKWEDGVYYYHCGNNADGTPIWMTETAAAGQASTVVGFIQNLTYNEKNNLLNLVETTMAAKYGWLRDVIVANRSAQGLGVDSASMIENVYRKELSGFFLASPAEPNWPASSDFTATAGSDFYNPVWGHALANPATVTDTVVLNEPYKEGFTFDGWYTSADFSGDKVTTIDENTPSCTLYAKWIEYIPTLAEVKAMAIDTETKTAGVVTFINIGTSSTNIYVQDATGGLLLFTKTTNTTLNVGDKVVVRGKMATFKGAPELEIIEIVSAEASTLPAAKKFDTFAAACDSTFTNLFTRVSFMGLKITSFDSYNNPYVTDGVDTLQCYKMVTDSTFKVGDKVNVTAILGYYNKYQLVGDVAGIEHIMMGVKDQYNYPARGANGEYTLENKWVISVTEDNYESNKPGVTKAVRGMVAKDGIMYFINRTYGSLVRVDGASGTMLDPIKITGDHLFQVLDTTNNTYKDAVTLAFNDIKLDGAGNCLIGACVMSTNHFMIYKVDLATGAATLLIDEKLVDNDDFATIADDSRSWAGRFDAFGVYGDVNGDAIVMAADANSFYAYKWTITNGVAGAAERIDCTPDPISDQSLLITDGELTVTSFSYAPQIFPVDESYFYVDGFNTLPMLFDMDGVLAEDFISSPNRVAVANNEGDTCKMNQGHNGICEFQIGDEYFMVMAATGTAGSPASAFALYKFADESKSFAGLEPLWYFPANGMGAASNECRTAVPSVEVDGDKATIYLYTAENGYGVYEFTSTATVTPPSAIENTEATEVTKIFENGQVYIIKNGVRYNVLGVVIK